MRTNHIDKELVRKIKSYLDNEKYGALTNTEIAVLCGTSASTVSRAANGHYDFMLKAPEPESDVNVAIDYATLKHLLACEYAIENILKAAQLPTNGDCQLFINNKAINAALLAYVPDDVKRRINELKQEE